MREEARAQPVHDEVEGGIDEALRAAERDCVDRYERTADAGKAEGAGDEFIELKAAQLDDRPFVRADDVPEYVQDGGVDCGITGLDLINERECNVDVLLRLGFGACSLQAAVWDRLLSLPVPFFRDFTAGDLALRSLGISQMRQVLTG